MNHLRDVIVADSDGVASLLTANGLPHNADASDHMPLVFTLDW